MTVLVQLSFVGVDAGPFNLFCDSTSPPYAVPFAVNVPAATLLAGAVYTVPSGTTTVIIRSTGTCTNDVSLPVVSTTTTTSSSSTSTTTSTTTVDPCSIANCVFYPPPDVGPLTFTYEFCPAPGTVIPVTLNYNSCIQIYQVPGTYSGPPQLLLFTQECGVIRQFSFTTQDSEQDFNFYWLLIGGLNTVYVEWGDGTVDTVNVSGVDNQSFYHNYGSAATRTILVTWYVPYAIDATLQYVFENNTVRPVTNLNCLNTNFSQIGINTNAATLTFTNLDYCTKLNQFNINNDYPIGGVSVTTIPLIDLSAATQLAIVNWLYCTINSLILPPSSPLFYIYLEDITPLGGVMNDLIIAADNGGQLGGFYNSFTSGTYSPAGLTAKSNLLGKGWFVTP